MNINNHSIISFNSARENISRVFKQKAQGKRFLSGMINPLLLFEQSCKTNSPLVKKSVIHKSKPPPKTLEEFMESMQFLLKHFPSCDLGNSLEIYDIAWPRERELTTVFANLKAKFKDYKYELETFKDTLRLEQLQTLEKAILPMFKPSEAIQMAIFLEDEVENQKLLWKVLFMVVSAEEYP